ncbi:hypothetical protein [Pontimicrobium sp. MEBiC06410]|jgi:hypothetical protein
MKRFTVLLACLLVFVLTSCQFSEDIYINEDGSGKMSFSFDGSELMQMAGDEMGGKEEVIDSTFSFKELFDTKRDSISKLSAEEQEKLKSLEPFNMHMVMNTKTSEMKFDMYREFSKADELQDMFKAMNNFSNMKGKGAAKVNDPNNPFSSLGKNGSTELSYSYNGRVFTRTAKILDKEAYKQMTDSISKMSMMFASSKYKLNYHFPKPIKSVSNEKALYSADRKSVTVEYGFMEYVSNPEALNLEVILED